MLSGGKDSNFALHWALSHGLEVCCAVTLKPPEDSMLLQFPSVELAKLQAEAMGIPSVYAEGEEELLADLLKRAREMGATHVVSGALLSDYQRQRMGLMARELGLVPVNPLWRIDQEEYMRMLVRNGFEVMIIRVAAYGLGPELLGKVLDEDLVEEIIRRARKYGFNPAFEGGEAETLVLKAPAYRKRLRVKGRPVNRGGGDWVYVIEEAELV
jgi:ABC transporter with metal-binding/Fe-S-binding domain ATP-binding protein